MYGREYLVEDDVNFELLGEDDIYDNEEWDKNDNRFPSWSRDLSSLDLTFSNRETYKKYFIPHETDNLTIDQINIGTKSLTYDGAATINSFQIGRPIGGGFYGVIYIVKHKDLYAVMKVVYKKGCKLGGVLEEVKNLTELNHPNIISFYDFFHDESRLYLVMEYAPGGDLKDLINRGYIPEDKVKVIFIQVLIAVAICHTHHIIHRDIKLENFVVGRDNNIKLIDFGLSVKFHPEDVITSYCGTLDYLAPEIIIGLSYDHKVDIWALGVLLHELISRYTPFEDEDSVATKNNIKYIAYRLNKEKIHAELQDLLRRIFQYADKRITTPEIFTHPWISPRID